MIAYTNSEKLAIQPLLDLGFELQKVVSRRSTDFLFYRRDSDGSVVQLARADLTEDMVRELATRFEPAKKTKKRKAKKSVPEPDPTPEPTPEVVEKDLTTDEKSSTMDSKTEDSLDGVDITPEESKAIDKLYLETHWSKPQE